MILKPQITINKRQRKLIAILLNLADKLATKEECTKYMERKMKEYLNEAKNIKTCSS